MNPLTVALRRRSYWRIFLALAVAVFALGPGVLRAQEKISATAHAQIEALMAEKHARTPAQQKMDSQLVYFVRKNRNKVAVAAAPQLSVDVQADAANRVLVDVEALVSPALRNFITKAGGVIVSDVPAFNAIRARMPAAMIEALAARNDVRFVQPAVSSTTNLGTVISQGVRTHRADTARTTFGADGTGIKIGVMSNGVDSLALSKANGNLNPNATVLSGQAGSGDEGTAMMEIVQDMAPGAQIIFATAGSGEASFASNILALQAAGCSVIVDDESYFDESPFQDMVIEQAVQTVSDAGVMYFSSAGNSGNLTDGTAGTWEGDFADGGALPIGGKTGRVHDFGGGVLFDTVNSGGSNYRVDLFWSDPRGASSNDYDLFITDASGNVLRSSTNIQNGTQNPYETVSTLNAGERIIILQEPGAAGRFLHLDTGRGRLAIATTGKTRGHNAPGAANGFGVAATNVADSPSPAVFTGGATNPVETFSSDGPRRMFFQANGTPITPGNFSSTGGQVLNKPDITAADGVSTSVAGFTSFFGTSAAAPHAAAIAALIKSYNPALTPAQIRTLLTSTALDIDTTGPDRDSGAGIVMALAALQAAPVPDVLTVAETGLDIYAPVGGPFTPTSATYTLTNTGGSPVAWTAASTQSWNSVTPASGTLAPGGTAVVTCTIKGDAAAALAAGTYADTVTIQNTGSGFSHTLSVNLTLFVAPSDRTLTVLPNDNSTSGNARAPITTFRYERGVYLITAAELAASGLPVGTQPDAIGWNYNTAPGVSGSAPLKVYLQNTTDTTNTKSTGWTTAISSMTMVHNATTTLPNVTGTFDLPFSGGSPFTYTGGGLYVAFDWGQYTGTLSTTAVVLCNSQGLVNGVESAQSTTSAPTTLSPSNFRPETRLSAPFIDAPMVTTPTVAGVTSDSATLGGDVTLNWNSAITARGVVYAKTSDNSAPQIGGSGVTVAIDAVSSTGVFSEALSNLLPGTAYSFAAYATNGGGTTYTTPASTFTTLTLQEAWRKQYFGITTNTGSAADTADPDGDGYNNLFEYVAGLVPTDGSSHFALRIQSVVGQPTQEAIIFSPIVAGRTYTVAYKTNLSDANWTTLTNISTSDNGSERTVIDLSAGAGPRFYQVQVSLP